LLCREDDERHRSLRAAEDMRGVPPNFIFYEIVRKKNFGVFQQHINHYSSLSLLLPTKLSIGVLVFSPTCEQTRQNQNDCILHRNLLPPLKSRVLRTMNKLVPQGTSNLKWGAVSYP
jgi:hypothetical protein